LPFLDDFASEMESELYDCSNEKAYPLKIADLFLV